MLTPWGKIVAAAAAAFLVAGAVAHYPELVAVGMACLLALVTGLSWVLLRPELVASRTVSPPRVTEGEPARAILTLTNEGARRSPPLLAVETIGDRRVAVPLPSLPPGEDTSARYELPTDRRGLCSVGPLTIARADPLRLVPVAQEHTSMSTLAVHPRVHVVHPVPTGRARDMDGPTTSTSPQRGIAFHSLREYVPGDDLRLIHWRSTARRGQLMVRHNVVPNEPRPMVVLDTSAALYGDGSFEDAVRVAASLCVAACEGGYPPAFRTTGGAVTAADRTGDGRAAILDLLAGIDRSDDAPGLVALTGMVPEDQRGVRPRLERGSAAVTSTTRGPAVDVALGAVVAGVTGLACAGFYAGWRAVPVILGAAAVPASLVLASVRLGWSSRRAAALAGAGLAPYAVLAVYWGETSAGLPGPAAWAALGHGLVDGWAEMLSVGLPADARGDLLVTPVVLTGAASAAAALLAVGTSSPLAPLGPPALAFVVALVLVAAGGERHLTLPAAALAAALLFLLVRTGRLAAAGVERARDLDGDAAVAVERGAAASAAPLPGDGRRPWRRVGPLAFGGPVVLALAVTGPLLAGLLL